MNRQTSALSLSTHRVSSRPATGFQRPIPVIAFCAIGLALAAAMPARATTYLWTGATSFNMSGTPGNYNPNGTPGASDIIEFNQATYTRGPSANASFTVGGLWFAAGNTGGLTIGSGGVTPGTITLQGTTINGAVNSGIVMDSGSGAVNVNALLQLGSSQNWTNNSATNTLTIGNTVSDGNSNFGITKLGVGKLALNGNNTFTGGLTIHAGTVVIGNGGALNSSAPNAVNFDASSNGGLSLNGQSITIGDLTSDATATASSITNGSTTNASTLTINDAGADKFVGSINDGSSSTLALIIAGAGSLKLTGTNGYSGGTTISNGTLNINSNSAIGAAGSAISFAGSGGTLQLGAANIALGARATSLAAAAGAIDLNGFSGGSLSGVLSGGQNLTINDTGGTGAETFTLSGASSGFTGATLINKGVLKVTGNLSGSAVTIGSGGTLGGTGTVGAVQVNSGGAIAPGSSPGTLNTGATSYNSGGAYFWEINKGSGTQGADPGWDFQNITGALTINSTPASPFTVKVAGLNTSNAAGAVLNFNQNQFYNQNGTAQWNIATASGGITGFAANKFAIDTSAFTNNNSIGNGAFALSTSGNNLRLTFTPNTLGVIATDNASNYATWTGNGGSGFGAWTITNNGNGSQSGQFVGASPEIDTNAKSWAMYANSSALAESTRGINGGLQVGHTLAFDIDNKSINNGGSVGVSLRNGTTNLFEFYFSGGNANYFINDNSAGNRNSTVPFTSAGLHLEFTLTGPNTYSLAITPVGGGATTTLTGSLIGNSTSQINTFRAFNFNAGNSNNAYFNSTNVLLPTWNGQSVGSGGGTFSGAGNWAAHGPVNGGSIAFDGTGSTVTNDAATSGVTSLYNILFNSTGGSLGGPNATVTTAAGPYTLQSTGLTATGLTLGGGITNSSGNLQTINFTGSGAVGVTLSAAQTFNGGAGGLSFGASTGVNLNGQALTVQNTGSGANAVTFNSTVSGTGAGSTLTKLGAGTLILKAANTYAGATTIGNDTTAGGILQLGVPNALPTTTSLTFRDGAASILDLNGNNQTVASLFDGSTSSGVITNSSLSSATFTLNNTGSSFYYGTLTGNASFVMTGAGSEELGGGAANTFSGGVTVKAATLIVGGTTSGTLGSGPVIVGDTAGNSAASLLIGRAGGTGPGATGGLTVSNNIALQDGTGGTLTLGGQNTSGINTFSGTVTLGRTAATAQNVTLIAAPGGEVDFTGGILANGASSGNVTIGSAGNTGTVKLTGTSTYTGTTSVSFGKLVLGAGGSLGATATTVSTGATLSAQPGSGAVSLAGPLTLSPGASFDMTDGAIGTFNLSASPTSLTIGGAGTAGTGPTLGFEIGSGTTGTDRVSASGAISVGASGGKISVAAASGATSITHGAYTLLSGGSLTGASGLALTASTLSLSGKTYNLALAQNGAAEQLIVTVAAPANAYWNGLQDGQWSTLGAGDASNWSTDHTGAVDTNQVPQPTTNVFFTVDTGATHLTNTLGADFSIAGLTFTGAGTTANSNSVTIGGGNTLTIGAGGITNNSSTTQNVGVNVALSAPATFNAGTAAGGALTVGVLGSTTLVNGGNRLTVSGSNATTIASAITGTGDLLKVGTGALTLSGPNSFGPGTAGTTNIFVDQGTIVAASSSALGASAGRIALGSSVTTGLNSALSIPAAGINVPNPIDIRYFTNVAGGKTLQGTNASGTATFSGPITLHDNLTLSAAGGTLAFGGAISTGVAGAPYANEVVFTGTPTGGFDQGPGLVTAGSGVIELDAVNTLTGETIVNSGITLQFNNGGSSNSSTIRMYGASTVNIATAAGSTESSVINPQSSIAGKKTVGATNTSGTATYGGSVFLDDDLTTVSTNSGATLSFTGTTFDLKNHALTLTGGGTTNVSSVLSNSTAGGTVKVNAPGGIVVLSNANTYSGGTTVSAGTLRVTNSSGSGAGSGPVNVNSGGTLGGTGSVSGLVTIASGGHLAPGASVGTLNVGSLTLAAGSQLDFEFNGVGNDLVAVGASGGLTINGGAFNLYNEGTTTPFSSNGTYHLIGYTGALGGAGVSALSVANQQPSHVYYFSADPTFHDIELTIGDSAVYNLVASTTATKIHVSSAPTQTSATLIATIVNAGSANADTLTYTNLNVSNSASLTGTWPKATPPAPIANGGGSDSNSGSFSSATAGSFTFTPSVATATNANAGTPATPGTVTSATINVYRLAAPSTLSTPVTLGNVHVGDVFVTQSVSLQNTAAADGFSEKLDAAFGTLTGSASAAGAVNLLSAGATDSASLRVGLGSGPQMSAGPVSGTARVNLTSNGAGTSGLGTTGLPAQTVSISGAVYRLAAPNTLPATVSLGAVHVGGTFGTQPLTLQNTATADGYSESLDASFGTLTGSASAAGAVSQLAAGASDSSSLVVGLGSAVQNSPGAVSGTVQIALASNGAGTSSLGTTNLAAQTVAITGSVYRLAAANTINPSVDLGNVHVGGVFGVHPIAVQNTATADGYSEALDASFGSLGGSASAAGSIAQLAAGGSDSTSLAVGLGSGIQSTPGAVSGTAQINLASNGAGTSSLGVTALPSQTVTITGNVYSGQSTWTGPSGGAWSSFANWDAGGAPGLDPNFATVDSATFSSASGAKNVDLASAQPSLNAITFTAGGSYTIVDTVGTGSITLAGATPTVQVAGSHAIATPIALAADTTVHVAGANDSLAISAPISGASRSLTLSGAGTLTLSAASSYSGGTTISGGTLRAANTTGSATGPGPVSITGGVLASGPAGAIGGIVDASTGAQTIAPGGVGAIGVLALSGGLTTGAGTTLHFDFSGFTGGDLLSVSGGGLTVATGTQLAFGANPTTIGDYRLIGGSFGAPNLANFVLPAAPSGVAYSLSESVDPGYIDLVVSQAGNDSVLSAAPTSVNFGRVMLGHVPTQTVTVSRFSGASATGYTATPSGDATATSSGSAAGAIPPDATLGVSLVNLTGARSGSVSIQNTGDDGSGPTTAGAEQGSGQSPVVVSVAGTILDNRVVTATIVDLGAVHLGGAASGMTNLTTSGDDNHFTRVTVAGQLFDSAAATGAATISPSLPTAGAIISSLTLTTSGEGLTGESPIDVVVPYSAQVFTGKMAWKPSVGSGAWFVDGNWSDTLSSATAGAPGLSGALSAADTATFGGASAATLIRLNGASPQLAAISLTGPHPYFLVQGSGGQITLSGGSQPASISADTTGHEIAAPVVLGSNVAVTVIGAENTLRISGALSDGGGPRSLTKLGDGELVLAATNTHSGGTIVSQGKLTSAADNALGSGALAINPIAGAGALVELAGNESLAGLSSDTSSAGSSASLTIDAGKTLATTQSADAVVQANVTLKGDATLGGGATLNVSGPAATELAGSTTLRQNSSLLVSGGRLRLSASAATLEDGVTATIATGASLELAGSVSALGVSGGSRATISNGGDFVTEGTGQVVGGIDGLGVTTIEAGADLTADHLVQNELVINGDMDHLGMLTIAPSSEPLILTGRIGGSLSASGGRLSHLLISRADRGGKLGVSPLSLGQASIAAVPEPATLVLGATAALSLALLARRRSPRSKTAD